MPEQIINLFSGWNQICINIVPSGGYTVSNIFSSVTQDGAIVRNAYNKTTSGVNNQFNTIYYSQYGVWYPEVTIDGPFTGLFVKVNSNITITITGEYPTSVPNQYVLSNGGWNLIGYPYYTDTTNIQDFLGNIPNSDGDIIRNAYNKTDSGANNQINTMYYSQYTVWYPEITIEAGKSYMVKINSATESYNLTYTYPPSTDTPIDQRRLPVPNDLSNSVIFSTNFYSATDLSNGEVPPNLFNSSGNPDISFTLARDFWLNEISNNDYFTDPSNSGITIITIQNLTSDHTIGAHTLQFLNWDISSNKNFGENASNNEGMFTGDGINNLANTMQFISGIRTLPISGDLVNLPLAIVNSNNTYNSFSTISGDSLNDLSNQFLNYMIVLGRPILVNIANLYDNISLTNIVDYKVNDSSTNLINWRSNSPYSSSANNVWIRDNKLYDSESNGNELPYPLILVPGVTYNFESNTDVSFSFTTNNDYQLNSNTPNYEDTITANTQYELTVTTNKEMNFNGIYNIFRFRTLASRTFVIKVTANDASSYQLVGEDRNGTVNLPNPNLKIKLGDTFSFQVDVGIHNFYIKKTITSNVNEGISNNGTNNREIIFTPTKRQIYYYNCHIHITNMRGEIEVE